MANMYLSVNTRDPSAYAFPAQPRKHVSDDPKVYQVAQSTKSLASERPINLKILASIASPHNKAIAELKQECFKLLQIREGCKRIDRTYKQSKERYRRIDEESAQQSRRYAEHSDQFLQGAEDHESRSTKYIRQRR
ncbi:hypothetical protein EVG20_g8960 [Dentipellis fragilis]|uniref:Uncharacterized protein n=1 Tax=Dentipellis fragilis TaxID=205917 RepID=A0A4Y9Y1L3_9AGAM|nr:hypothetical protein EVG20_g8960 [Dentipellis fragilis]